MTYPVHAAKTQLSRLIQDALAGEEVLIGREGAAEVRLVPADAPLRPKRQPGTLKGAVTDAFFDPLPADELALWNGEDPAKPGKEG